MIIAWVTLLITAEIGTRVADATPTVREIAKPTSSADIRVANQPQYLGCYADDENRRLRGEYARFSEMTPQLCIDVCRNKSYAYASIQAWDYCFCGGQRPVVFDLRPETDCHANCPGDKSSKCGGPWRNSVYKTGAVTLKHEYLGCYSDGTDRRLKGASQEFDTLTPRICIDYCKERSFLYAGLQNKTQCFCGNDSPDSSNRNSEADCDMNCPADYTVKCGGNWRNSVYKTEPVNGTPISEEIPGVVVAETTKPVANFSTTEKLLLDFVGCYADGENRKIRGLLIITTQMTPQLCVDYCKSKSYMFAGIQARMYCFCGDQTPVVFDKRPEIDCQLDCPGDKNSKCGGEWRNSVYRTGAVPIHHEYLGCYIDDPDRKLKGELVEIDALTPRICVDHCKEKGYIFAGLQSTKFCLCGNETMNELDRRSEGECEHNCPGDYAKKCGSHWRNSIYKTEPVKRTDIPLACQISLTTVNNQRVCANTVVFEEHFDEISQEKWKHLVQIRSKPDYRFVIYNSHPVNSLASNGKLIIKPTLLTDDQVRYGDLQLAKCTGEKFSYECGYKAGSYNILPPVQTARLTTHNSFAFRYGKVEITAKLPLGDWLVPELWLEPKNIGYNSEYSSRRIQIAMSRGNRDLKIDGQDIGCKQLESGVLMSIGNNVRTRTVIQNAEDCWYQNYHNYTLIWTPENIIFTVDGGQPQSLIPNRIGTLTDIIGFPPGVTSTHTWGSISKTAPFDNEFYITVGLSAGGMLDFPNDSINRGKPKPWRNFELKSLLNFWRDQNSWKPTWNEDTALLQVDHIKVTAL